MFNQILNNAMKFNVSTVSVEFTSNTIWTAPSTGNVVFECWGGGGDGGGNGAGTPPIFGGGGGGAGGYAKKTLNLSAGSTVSVNIGGNFFEGGTTWIQIGATVCSARGGAQGIEGTDTSSGRGGTGGSGTIGDTFISGANGAAGSGNNGGAGANGLKTGTGSGAGGGLNLDGSSGTQRGAGGGGAGKQTDFTSNVGGAGIDGIARITYNVYV